MRKNRQSFGLLPEQRWNLAVAGESFMAQHFKILFRVYDGGEADLASDLHRWL